MKEGYTTKTYVDTFLRFRILLYDLVLRDIKVKYRRSVLGVVWSVLNPLLMMLVMTAVFSAVFKVSIPNFQGYFLTGFVLFNFYGEATSGAMSSVLGSASLIKKVYIPKYLFAVEKVLFAFINFAFALAAVAIVLIATKVPIKITVLLAPIPVLYTFIFALGIGLILAVCAVFFRDTLHLYTVLLTALNYFTPIFYPEDIIPEKIQWLYYCNPLVHFVKYFRSCVIHGEIPDLKTNLLCAAFAFGALILGLILFKKKQDSFVLYV